MVWHQFESIPSVIKILNIGNLYDRSCPRCRHIYLFNTMARRRPYNELRKTGDSNCPSRQQMYLLTSYVQVSLQADLLFSLRAFDQTSGYVDNLNVSEATESKPV